MLDLARLREAAGLVWGKATTEVAWAAAALLAAPLPTGIAIPGWLRWTLFVAALVVGALRHYAPPPPAVTIKRDDAVNVNHIAGVITITKAEDIPAAMQSKAAGVAATDPPPSPN